MQTGSLAEIVAYRELLWSLAWRDIRSRYKQSLLGVAWAILLPLSMMLIFTFVFTRAIDAGSIMQVRTPYALYAYVGLVPWTFFSMGLGSCVQSLVANRNLVTKVYFPREVFPLSCVVSSFVDFAVASSVLIGLAAFFHVRGAWSFPGGWQLAYLPLILIIQTALLIGLGMMLSMANLFYRDVRQIVGAGMQLLMFISNVVVPVPREGTLGALLHLNPLVHLFAAYRDCLLHGEAPSAGGLLYAGIVAAVCLIGGWTIFRRASYRFAECV